MRLLCSKVLAADSMRHGKLKRHLETTHSESVGKPTEFFQRKLDEFTKQKQTFEEIVDFPSNASLASYLVSYRIAKYTKPHTIAETLALPAAIDMVKIMFREFHAKRLRQIPLNDNTVSKRINDISEDICHHRGVSRGAAGTVPPPLPAESVYNKFLCDKLINFL